MKKVLALFFLMIYLTSTTELAQLLKIPVLLEHLEEHQEKNKQLSILDFLILHYQTEGKNIPDQDHDADKDQQLPFMNHVSPLNVIFIAPPSIEIAVLHQPLLAKIYQKFIIYHSTFWPKGLASAIWQPPKFSV